MSNAIGRVRFSDGLQLSCLYWGSIDRCRDQLYLTDKEAWELGPDAEPRYPCGHDGEPVEIASEYGAGFHWNGTACRECMLLLSGNEPRWDSLMDVEVPTTDGLPDWWRH